jgi:hypothetical protein
MKRLLVILLLAVGFCFGPVYAEEMTIGWSDTVEIADTASVDTTIAYSDEYPIYGWQDNQPFLHFYNSFIVKAVAAIQAARYCSVTVAIQLRPTNTSTWTLFDSLTIGAAITDVRTHRPKRITMDSVNADSTLPRARWFRVKAIKKATYLAVDTLIVGNIYKFDVVVDAVGRY